MIHLLWWLASLFVLLCGSVCLRAEGPDDQYVRIYNLIQQADGLEAGGRSDLARQKYSEAQTELDRVQKAYPGWNEQVIRFRLDYLMEKLGPAKPEEKPSRREPTEQPPLASAELADRPNPLLEQIRQLTADKELLQAKLKEALSAQPASVDPRELARAEEQIKSLRKEVEVLTVSLKKAETKTNKPIDPVAMEQTKQELAAANQKLNESVARSQSLAKELVDTRRAAQTNADLVSVLQIALGRALAEKDALGKKQAGTPPDSALAAQRGQVEPLTDQSKTNVYILANLAAAQIGQNRLAEGEANLKRALADDPKNAVSLSLLGGIKVRQHKYDEALDLLSQSAQLDAQNPDTFQYLGVTLAAKGLRTPAESAFRRAIQLAPENAEAHHNLAIVYATQQPPALELARLHYQKGLASGYPKDPKLEKILNR